MNSSAAPQQILAGCWTEVKWGKVERCVCECLCVSMVVLAFSAQGPNAFRELADTLWAVWAAASLCQASPLFLLLPCTPPTTPSPRSFHRLSVTAISARVRNRGICRVFEKHLFSIDVSCFQIWCYWCQSRHSVGRSHKSVRSLSLCLSTSMIRLRRNQWKPNGGLSAIRIRWDNRSK